MKWKTGNGGVEKMTIEEAREYWSKRLERTSGYSDEHWDAEERHAHADYIDALKHAIAALAICREREETAKKPKTVRHGRWIEKPPYSDETVKGLEFQIVCSRCDEQNSSITFDENSVPIAKTFYRTKFCPNCGARMDADHIDDVSKKVGGADNGNG